MPHHDKLVDARTPRETIAALLDEHVSDPERRRLGHDALAWLRDPPSPDAAAAYLAPGPKAVRRHG